MDTSDPRLTALKIAYKGELHRVRVDLAAFQYTDLATLFAATFNLSPSSFLVQYTDAEGDVLNVTSQAEYLEACRVFLTAQEDATTSLRFSAVSRSHVLFQENVADPILKALEKLVETLTEALHKVQQEEWKQRAQAGVQAGVQVAQAGVQAAQAGVQAAQARAQAGVQVGLQHTEAFVHRAHENVQTGVQMTVERSEEWAQRAQANVQIGLDQTSEVLTRAAKDARESLTMARQSLQEIPFDQIIKETGENLKAAAEGFQTLAHDVVGEMKKINLSGEVAEVTPAAPADPEWEQVDEAVAVPEVVEDAPAPAPAPEPEVVEVVAPSAEEIKWATEIGIVRDVFPDVDTQRVIENLEQCNGNVHVVINALMEDM